MLDRKFIVEHAEAVKQNCTNRGLPADVDRYVELDQSCREQAQRVQDLNRQANEVSKTIGKAKDAEEREARKNEGRQLREQKDKAQSEHDELVEQLTEIQRSIPNMAHPDAPIGKDDKANLEVARGDHEPQSFDFKPLDHVDLGEKLDLFDFEAGSKTTGHGFYFLKNDAVLLELALQRYALEVLMQEGFTLLTTPDLARNEILEGVGFNPRGAETQIYSIVDTDLSLVATAEITLGGSLAGETLDLEQLPLKMCGVSHCFRTEAGAHGRATRGLYRVHQFTKVEMFAFTSPDQSEEMLQQIRRIECQLFNGLGIPFRVVDTATGDLGSPAYRKFDLEAWMPGRGENGEYGEVTSTSNCTDYQARRLNIRFKTKGEKGTRFVHTLNGTAIAISRAMIAVIENYQQADGTIAVPEVLRPFMGKEIIGA
ncbi:MAG: serine--tRNA ligase [Planctomycetaceae bacterium]|nr:serine--tRNA ligase [Planctomycetaceae bacterium]